MDFIAFCFFACLYLFFESMFVAFDRVVMVASCAYNVFLFSRYMKAVSILKTCDFKTNAHNARALEVMIPCLNNTATCKIKLKEYKDATLLSENVSGETGVDRQINR